MKKYLVLPTLLLVMLLAACGNSSSDDTIIDRNQSDDNDVIDDNDQIEKPFIITITLSEAVEDISFFNELDQEVSFTSSDNITFTIDATDLSSIRLESESFTFDDETITLTNSSNYSVSAKVIVLANDYERVMSLINNGATEITLENDLIGDITLTSHVAFDLNGYRFIGDLTLDYTVALYSIENGTFNGTITANEYIQNFIFDGTGDFNLVLNDRVLNLSVPFDTTVTLAGNDTEYYIGHSLKRVVIEGSNIDLRFDFDIEVDMVEILEEVENTTLLFSHVIQAIISNGTGTVMNVAVANTSGSETITVTPVEVVNGGSTRTLTVPNGTTKEAMLDLLSDTAMITIEGNRLFVVPVTWNEGSNYDPANLFSSNVLFNGTLELPVGFVNPTNQSASYLVRVQQAELTVDTFTAIDDLVYETSTITHAMVLSELPESVLLTTTNGLEFTVDLTWTVDETVFDDTSFLGHDFTLVPTFSLPSYITNTVNFTPSVSVEIPSHVTPPSGFFDIQTDNPYATIPTIFTSNGYEEGSSVSVTINETPN